MADSFMDGFKKIMMAGVDAVTSAGEKVEDFVRDMVQKGELTAEQGRDLGEKLKQELKEKQAKSAMQNMSSDDIVKALETLTPEERDAVKEKLDALAFQDQAEQAAEDQAP